MSKQKIGLAWRIVGLVLVLLVGAMNLIRLPQSNTNRSYSVGDIGALIASGSVATAGMIIAPCSMRTLAAIATGHSDNLLTRAADVHLKERRKLVLIARETPLHLVHLRNMCTVTELGAIVMPPVPAFYFKPQSVDEVADQIAARAIDLIDIGEKRSESWAGIPAIR